MHCGSFDQVVRRYGVTSDLALQQHIAAAMVGKGSAIVELGLNAEAADIYNEVFVRFGDATDSELRKQVAIALRKQGASQAVASLAGATAAAPPPSERSR